MVLWSLRGERVAVLLSIKENLGDRRESRVVLRLPRETVREHEKKGERERKSVSGHTAELLFLRRVS